MNCGHGKARHRQRSIGGKGGGCESARRGVASEVHGACGAEAHHLRGARVGAGGRIGKVPSPIRLDDRIVVERFRLPLGGGRRVAADPKLRHEAGEDAEEARARKVVLLDQPLELRGADWRPRRVDVDLERLALPLGELHVKGDGEGRRLGGRRGRGGGCLLQRVGDGLDARVARRGHRAHAACRARGEHEQPMH
jgi:hypothetical protein